MRRIAQARTRLGHWWRSLVIPVSAVRTLLGLGLLAAGMWLWWPPGALLVPGAVLVAIEVVGQVLRLGEPRRGR